MKRVLVMGIGNILLSDEGVGVRVIEAMRNIGLPDDVELVDAGTAGADLVDIVADRAKLIVVDAIQSELSPGTVLRMTEKDILPTESSAVSLHELGLPDALEMTRRLGCSPREVVVFGIVPQSIQCGLELTECIAAVVPRVIELVLNEAGK